MIKGPLCFLRDSKLDIVTTKRIFKLAEQEADRFGLAIGEVYNDCSSYIFNLTDGLNPPTPGLPVIEVFNDGRIAYLTIPSLEIFERINNLKELKEEISMKVRYVGDNGSIFSVLKDHVYECVGVEGSRFRVIDEEGEDYLYPISDFEIVDE